MPLNDHFPPKNHTKDAILCDTPFFHKKTMFPLKGDENDNGDH